MFRWISIFSKNKRACLKNFVLLCCIITITNGIVIRVRHPVLRPTYVSIKLDCIKLSVKHYRYICIYTIQNKR